MLRRIAVRWSTGVKELNKKTGIAKKVAQADSLPLEMCAEHVRQYEGESPLPNLMEVKG